MLARACLEGARLRLDEDTAADLALVTTEVVSNAVKHAGMGPGEDIILRVNSWGPVVRVEVLDTGPGFTSRPGWGTRIIEQVAKDWGVARQGNRTNVWFEVGPPMLQGDSRVA